MVCYYKTFVTVNNKFPCYLESPSIAPSESLFPFRNKN